MILRWGRQDTVDLSEEKSERDFACEGNVLLEKKKNTSRPNGDFFSRVKTFLHHGKLEKTFNLQGRMENCEKMKKPLRLNVQFGMKKKQMWRPKWPFGLYAFLKKKQSYWFAKFNLINYGL